MAFTNALRMTIDDIARGGGSGELPCLVFGDYVVGQLYLKGAWHRHTHPLGENHHMYYVVGN